MILNIYGIMRIKTLTRRASRPGHHATRPSTAQRSASRWQANPPDRVTAGSRSLESLAFGLAHL